MGYIQNPHSVVPMSINLPKSEYAKAGAILKELREKAGLSTPELADLVSEGAYHDILKYEQGFQKIPYTQLNVWAPALNVSPGYLARRLVKHYDPELYDILYDSGAILDVDQSDGSTVKLSLVDK